MTAFDYTTSRNKIIAAAYEIVGVKPVGQPLSAAYYAQGVETLEIMVKAWPNEHLFLWSYDRSSFATVVDLDSYSATLNQAILGVDKAWVVSGDDELPITVIPYSQFLDIRNRAQSTGRPLYLAFKPEPEPSVVLWPIPDQVYTIQMLCVFPLEDFDAANDLADIPPRFYHALLYGLANDLFDKHPAANTRLMDRVEKKAMLALAKAKSFDTPRSECDEVESLFGSDC